MSELPSLLSCLEDAEEAALRLDKGWDTNVLACVELLRAAARLREDENLLTSADMLESAQNVEANARPGAVLEALRIARQILLSAE